MRLTTLRQYLRLTFSRIIVSWLAIILCQGIRVVAAPSPCALCSARTRYTVTPRRLASARKDSGRPARFGGILDIEHLPRWWEEGPGRACPGPSVCLNGDPNSNDLGTSHLRVVYCVIFFIEDNFIYFPAFSSTRSFIVVKVYFLRCRDSK